MTSTSMLAVAVVALLLGPAHAQTGLAPERAATPSERPGEPAGEATGETTGKPAPAAAPAPAPAGPAEAPAAAPVPPEDPDIGAEAPAESPPPAAPPVQELLAEDDAELAACLGRLRALGTRFERADPVSDTATDGAADGAADGGAADGGAADNGAACGIANPIRVSEIVPGVALESAGIMRCATAAALAEWVATFVLPASRMLPERGPLTAVRHGSTYVCRRIGGDGELSEHAFGNAVDIMGFDFAEGPSIPVESRDGDGTIARAFQRTARAAACLGFTTVIGPGQEDHGDHLHFDIKSRESGYRLCQ